MNKFVFILLSHLVAISLSFASDYTLSQFINVQFSRQPSFHPAGSEISFISNVSGQPQVWRIVDRRGKLVQTTFEPDGVEGAWWSPASPNHMIIAASRGGSEKSKLFMVDPSRSPLYPLTPVDDDAINRFGCWASDGSLYAFASNARNGVDFDIFEHDVAEAAPRKIYEGTGHLSAVTYSRDKRYLVLLRDNSNVDSDLILFDRQTGEAKVLTEHEGDERYQSPAFDEKGTSLITLSNRGREYVGIAAIDIYSGVQTWLETPEAEIDMLAVAPDGLGYAYAVNDRGYSRFHFVNLRKETRVGDYRFPDGIITGFEYSPDSKRLAITFGTADRPFDVWLYDPAFDVLSQVTFSATGGVPTDLFVKPEVIEYESFDKLKIPAFWYKPRNATQAVPAIIAIHGGPESQARPDLSGLFQYFVHQGYAILEPNVRGSSGFGRTYLTLDNVRKRLDSVKDIEYAAKWLGKQKGVDKSKIVLYGGSYGGFMVLAALTNYPELFAAGIDVVGISNFVTFLENTGKYRKALREAEYGSLETDREFLEEVSPLNHVNKIKAPLFVIQGANDPRVPQSESDQMVAAIRARGGTVEYLVFEDEGHGLRKTENKLAAYQKVVEFLDAHVK